MNDSPQPRKKPSSSVPGSTESHARLEIPNPNVRQGGGITEKDETEKIANGVGPQLDEHRGNSQGGFTYESSDLEENHLLRSEKEREPEEASQ